MSLYFQLLLKWTQTYDSKISVIRSSVSFKFKIINLHVFQSESDNDISNWEGAKKLTFWVSLAKFYLFFDQEQVCNVLFMQQSVTTPSVFVRSVSSLLTKPIFQNAYFFFSINQTSSVGAYCILSCRNSAREQYLKLTKCNWYIFHSCKFIIMQLLFFSNLCLHSAKYCIFKICDIKIYGILKIFVYFY